MRLLPLLLVAFLAPFPGALRAEERPSEEEIGSIHVYLTPDEAIREIFEDVARVDTVTAVLTPEEMKDVLDRSGCRAPSDTIVVYRPHASDGSSLGLAVIAEEVGKYRPITFLVGTHPDRRVLGVEVLVYRESRGGEVRRTRFLRQYNGKDAEDPIRTNRDVINVAGATLSVGALNRGVKRVLVSLELLARRMEL